jgi:hypothetical protein
MVRKGSRVQVSKVAPFDLSTPEYPEYLLVRIITEKALTLKRKRSILGVEV